MKMLKDVEEFHRKMGLSYDGPPRALSDEVFELRNKLNLEELREYQNAQRSAAKERDQPKIRRGYVDLARRAAYTEHLEELLDALVDRAYILMGDIYAHGLGPVFEEAWDRVHAKNMQKVRASSPEESKRGSTLDAVKPEDWTPPNHRDLVAINDVSA